MRYYSFNEFDGEKGWVSTISEEEIRQTYYPYWKEKMIKKFGEEEVEKNCTFEHCLEDWVDGNWAWSLDRMSLSDILDLISEIDEKEITKPLVQELVLRAHDEGKRYKDDN